MERLLKALILSGKHLQFLDSVFSQEYRPYLEIAQKLQKVPFFNDLQKEIYAGGKKRGKYGYGRQMILGDLLQYILTGRGYYFAVKGPEQMKCFIRILMYISNLLILMEDISVDVDLRNKVLNALQKKIGPKFFEGKKEKEEFCELKKYEGKIVGKEGKQHENFFDSILPKRVGGIPEFLVYAYLIRKNYGYVVSLLQAQRLLGHQKYIIPPDFLLLRSKGEIFGIEVGIGKERQVTSFSTITSIPVFMVTIGGFEQPQPYRCGKCQKWITYCDKVIEVCANNKDKGRELNCKECEHWQKGKCPFIVYYGEAYDYSNKIRKLRYHYRCVKNDTKAQKKLKRALKPKLIAPLPWVSGLKQIKEEG